MNVVKVSLTVVGSLIALLLVAAVVVFWLFDPNAYKGYVAGLVTERTGRDFEIRDDLELSFFPWLAVETGGLTFGNAAGFGEQPMATVERVAARIKLLPLLSRRIEIGTIALDGVQLDLARTENGRDNWSDLMSPRSVAGGAQAVESESDNRLADLDIEGIRIRGARVVWRENGNDIRYIVNDLRFTTGPIRSPAQQSQKL
jgi:AsmA protein